MDKSVDNPGENHVNDPGYPDVDNVDNYVDKETESGHLGAEIRMKKGIHLYIGSKMSGGLWIKCIYLVYSSGNRG